MAEIKFGDPAENSSDSESGPLIPILITDDAPAATYVNMVVVNFDRQAFQVVFAQQLQPILGTDLDLKNLLDQGHVKAKEVARLVMTSKMVEETIELLQRQLAEQRRIAESELSETGQ